MTENDDTSLDAHGAYCEAVDKECLRRFGVDAVSLISDEELACNIIQDGWANDSKANVVIDAMAEHKASESQFANMLPANSFEQCYSSRSD